MNGLRSKSKNFLDYIISMSLFSGTIFLIFIVSIFAIIFTYNAIAGSGDGFKYILPPVIETTVKNKLPEGSRNVVDLGNHWYIFELDVNNKTRKFLYHSMAPRIHMGDEMITELKD
jgi:hypothetical protein